MLVLTRKVSEEIVIGDNIIVTVLEIRGGRVVLGITAPQHVTVLRGEVPAIKKRLRAPRAAEKGVPETVDQQHATPVGFLPPTAEICRVLEEEVRRLGGTVLECLDDGRNLLFRSVLPLVGEVRPNDVVNGGVAVTCAGGEIEVHPYLLRRVCRNGAVRAVIVSTRRVSRESVAAPSDEIAKVLSGLRDAVRACAEHDLWAAALEQLRSAAAREVDMRTHHLLVDRLARTAASRQYEEIMRRFGHGRDRSVFGLMNAVTSVARDEPDPEMRWRLEELGGQIPTWMSPTLRPGGASRSQFLKQPDGGMLKPVETSAPRH